MATLKSGTTVGGSPVLTDALHNNTGNPHNQYTLTTDLVTNYYNKTQMDILLDAKVDDTQLPDLEQDKLDAQAAAAAAALSETNAAASAASASTSASQAATSASSASTSASEAATSEANAALYETNAAASEANAATSETNAATSATDAANQKTYSQEWAQKAEDTPVSVAAGGDGLTTYSSLHHAAKASDSASAAATSASNANTFMTTALSAQTAAEAAQAASETARDAAQAAQAATEAVYDSFDDRYLGAKASDPTVDNDGNALITGALYFNTTTSMMNTYTGSEWQPVADREILELINTTKAVTAVDVFIYDTSRDSDGGAWRVNGEIPVVSVITAQTSLLTIYSGDDPTIPVFDTKDFTGYTIKSVTAQNGKIVVGTTAGVVVFDYAVGDTAVAVDYSTSTTPAIVNNTVNDVAMTILPNAPVDPTTGLPIPTIAVATDGGVNVIKDDGSVVDITYSTYQICNHVDFRSDGALVFVTGNSTATQGWVHVFHNIPESDVVNTNGYAKGSADELYTALYNVSYSMDMVWPGTYSGNEVDSMAGDVWGGDQGLICLSPNQDAPSEGMLSHTTSTYNTGWMHGDIKGAWLADTTAESISGSELVTNGTFDTDISGWADIPTAPSTYYAQAEVVSGQYVIQTQGGLNSDTSGYQDVETIVGRKYVASVDVSSDNDRHAGLRINNVDYTVNDGTVNVEFTATTNPTRINLRILPYGTSTTYTLDNVSVRLVEEDRSVNNNPLNIIGSLTKSPVATGSELVAYSGFSTTNYLEQPYNSSLDFGTGDFYMMGWVYNPSTPPVESYIMSRFADDSAAPDFDIGVGSTDYKFRINAGSTLAFNATSTPKVGVFQFLTVCRSNGVIYFYVDGELTNSVANSTSLTNTLAHLNIGVVRTGSAVFPFQGSLALWRIGAGAPTADQIKKIYEDEKVLFQDNAACTLYGSSDAVTALAHDPVTDLLHVGTSSGRSVFQGLRRVDNTTDPVGASISAVNSLVVED